MRICRFCTIYTQECRAKLYDAKRLKATHVRCSHSIMCQLFMSSVIKHATLARNNKVIIILRSTERQTRNAASSPFEFEKRKNPEHNFWMMFKWWSTHGPMIYLQWKINVYKSISKQSLIRINQSDFVSFFSPLFLSHSFLIVSFRISLPLVVTCFFFSFHFQLNNDPSIQSEKQVKKTPFWFGAMLMVLLSLLLFPSSSSISITWHMIKYAKDWWITVLFFHLLDVFSPLHLLSHLLHIIHYVPCSAQTRLFYCHQTYISDTLLFSLALLITHACLSFYG